MGLDVNAEVFKTLCFGFEKLAKKIVLFESVFISSWKLVI